MKRTDRFIYDRVYLIGVDGAGCFFTKASTPGIDEIFEHGAYNHHTLTAIPTISAQCWGSMLHGCSPAAHRLTNGTCGTTPLPPDYPYPSFFSAARKAFPDAETAAVCCWNAINVGIIEPDINVRKATGEDDEVCERVCEYIEKYDPKLIFVQFDSVDGAGHRYGYGTKGHLDQITHVDGLIKKIYDTAKNTCGIENTLFMVTADHGGTPDGNHGGDTDAEKYVSLFALGRSVIPGQFGYAETRDCASIVAHALGFAQPESWSSRIPDGLFTDGVSFERKSEIPTGGKKRYSDRRHLPAPVQEGRRLLDFCDKNGLITGCEFDKALTDIVSGGAYTADGKLYYTDGFYSQCATLDDCRLILPDVHFGTQDFTVCVWIKTDTIPAGEKRTVFSTKGDSDPFTQGIELYMKDGFMTIEIGTGERTAHRYSRPLPPNCENNWFHFITSLDRSENELCFYYDFYLEYDWYLECNIPEENTLDGSSTVCGNKTSFSLDDLLVFSHKLSDPEIDALAFYYEQDASSI